MIKFTVITVTFNCKETIERTINSVLSQRYKNFEYIVIDGCSDDGTCDIISKYADGISTYISESDSGVFNAMNKGIALSTGSVIEFLNGDDYFFNEDILGEVAETFESNSEIDILVGKDKGEIASSIHYPEKYTNVYADAVFPHQAVFARKRVFDEIGNFDESFKISADRDWILRAWSRGYHFELVDSVFVVNEPGGLSFGCDTPLEEYNIAKKYLNMPGQEEFLKTAADRTSRIYGDWYIKKFFRDGSLNEEQKRLWSGLLRGGNNCIIYGNGDFGRIFTDSLKRCGIQIDGIVERGAIRTLDNTPVDLGLSEFVIAPIVISTSLYDSEIYEYLVKEGVDTELIVPFSSIRKRVVDLFDQKYNLRDYVRTKTGLELE